MNIPIVVVHIRSSLMGLSGFLNGYTDDIQSGWDEFIGVKHIWHLQCRMDHVGWIDSEDPLIFRVCALEVLRVMLVNRERVLESIGACNEGRNDPDEIFIQIFTGIAKMIELCHEHGCAFWTSGYEVDRQRVLDWMRWTRLSPDDPDYCVAPHVSQRRSEGVGRAQNQLSALRSLAQSGVLEHRLRVVVNQLPQVE